MEYGPTNAALKLILQHDLFRKHWGIYLDEEFVGTLCHNVYDNSLNVAVLNLSARKEVVIKTDLPSWVSSYELFP